MPTLIDDDLADKLSRYFALFAGEKNEKFAYEREIRLFQFQNWICFPERKSDGPRNAGYIAAAKILNQIEYRYTKKQKKLRGTAACYLRMFENAKYASLFDATLGFTPEENQNNEYGWARLINIIDQEQFDREVERRRKSFSPIIHMIDYLFRILEHNIERKQEANIKRAQFYVWKDNFPSEHKMLMERGLSSKTLKSRWSDLKASAIFLYVSERYGFDFYPRLLCDEGFLEGMSAEANDTEKLIEYLGKCHYVGTILSQHANIQWPFDMPIAVAESDHRPETQPLSLDELSRMDDYKNRLSEFEE